MVSTGQASCTWSNKRVCSVFDLLTVAYLRFHFGGGGGGVKLILGQWRFLHDESMRLLGWLGGMLHSRIVFKNGAIWCVLEYILLQFCKKNVKMFIFCIKIIDIGHGIKNVTKLTPSLPHSFLSPSLPPSLLPSLSLSLPPSLPSFLPPSSLSNNKVGNYMIITLLKLKVT